MMDSLEGRVIAVTGASGGFGLAMAKALLDAGANVGLIARRADKLESLCAELGPNAFAAPADVGRRGEALMDSARAAIHRLHRSTLKLDEGSCSA